jgi:cytochrome c oxidase subunit 1
MAGMPRRTHTYLEGTGWQALNFAVTIGAFILAVGILMFLIDMVRSYRKGVPAGNDPWNARTLEWSIPSPPPVHNFDRTPIVKARDAFWLHKFGAADERMGAVDPGDHGIHMPSKSWMPLLTSSGFLVFGISMAMKSAGIPLMGYLAIAGLSITLIGIYLWALEGPGGYHLHPEGEHKPH